MIIPYSFDPRPASRGAFLVLSTYQKATTKKVVASILLLILQALADKCFLLLLLLRLNVEELRLVVVYYRNAILACNYEMVDKRYIH